MHQYRVTVFKNGFELSTIAWDEKDFTTYRNWIANHIGSSTSFAFSDIVVHNQDILKVKEIKTNAQTEEQTA